MSNRSKLTWKLIAFGVIDRRSSAADKLGAHNLQFYGVTYPAAVSRFERPSTVLVGLYPPVYVCSYMLGCAIRIWETIPLARRLAVVRESKHVRSKAEIFVLRPFAEKADYDNVIATIKGGPANGRDAAPRIPSYRP